MREEPEEDSTGNISQKQSVETIENSHVKSGEKKLSLCLMSLFSFSNLHLQQLQTIFFSSSRPVLVLFVFLLVERVQRHPVQPHHGLARLPHQ